MIEEDGDEIFTKMPKRCLKFSCGKAKIKKNKKGFYCCLKCGASYGK
jgi:hypothetical protein